jgi:hypothetical protein
VDPEVATQQRGRHRLRRWPATRVVSATIGVLAAVAGVEHGVGEILQGPGAPAGLVIQSWPDTPAFEILGGEPAMTVLPDVLVSGIVTVVVATALGAWSIWGTRRPRGGLVMIAMSLVLLLVGGGFGPPLLGTIAGIGATRIGVVPSRPPGRLLRALAPLWRFFLIACVLGFLALVPGVPLLFELAGVESEALVFALIGLAFGSLVLALPAARGFDRTASLPAG